MIPEFYTKRPEWTDLIEQIGELIGRVGALEELSPSVLELRRANRIGSVHSSTAIEGNTLTLAQVDAVAGGVAVYAPPQAVQEVENALAAYSALDTLNPFSVEDFLRAHRMLTAGLVSDAGAFRTGEVDIVGSSGQVLHSGSRAEKVPRLIAELFEWAHTTNEHPLIVASAVHFLIEHIHPFRDGNGRIGRLWQTLMLSRWREAFAWMPTETLIRRYQSRYYDALQQSREPEIDAAPFIDFMFDVIIESLTEHATHTQNAAQDVGVNVGVNVGVSEGILTLLRARPDLNAEHLADQLGVTKRTIERHLAGLKKAGALVRVGSPKAGHWEIQE